MTFFRWVLEPQRPHELYAVFKGFSHSFSHFFISRRLADAALYACPHSNGKLLSRPAEVGHAYLNLLGAFPIALV